MSADDWVSMAHSEGTADCHALKGPGDRPWACAGLAVYRANICKRPRDPSAMTLPADRASVFASPAQFKAHHEKRDD
jgi:hypothetical protein